MSTDKSLTIIVNARPRRVSTKTLTFGEVVALAFDAPPTGEDVMFTITIRRGDGAKLQGPSSSARASR